MLKSPEQYLSGLSFIAEDEDKDHLDAGELAFVEKYLGLDALPDLPEQEPQAIPLPELAQPAPKPQLMLAERQIVVAPAVQEQLETKPAPVIEIAIAPEQIVEQLEAMPGAARVGIAEALQPPEQPDQTAVAKRIAVEAPVETVTEVAVEAPATVEVEMPVAAEAPVTVEAPVETNVEVEAPVETAAKVTTEAPLVQTQAVKAVPAVKPEVALREKWRKAAEIQMVSFFVAGQIFLLPVEGIKEVVRHMELIKVPQAPEFVAGCINLRGHVTPIVYLSALLTNEGIKDYDERNFIIVTGSEKLQLGLIIDKVNSMHMVPQNKIIWNPESKLAEAAEFLNAIVDLDDHVCGMVAPENITRLIMPELD